MYICERLHKDHVAHDSWYSEICSLLKSLGLCPFDWHPDKVASLSKNAWEKKIEQLEESADNADPF